MSEFTSETAVLNKQMSRKGGISWAIACRKRLVTHSAVTSQLGVGPYGRNLKGFKFDRQSNEREKKETCKRKV